MNIIETGIAHTGQVASDCCACRPEITMTVRDGRVAVVIVEHKELAA